ncbi:MAG: hypothetical protein ACE5EQ_06975 [Phycisphaerae bacterium]
MDESGSRRQVIKLSIAVVVFIAAGVVAYTQLGGEDATQWAAERVYICVETRKPFEHTLQIGDKEPIYSPYSKKNTGYKAELCFWTKDENGEWKAKTNPTFVFPEWVLDPKVDEEGYEKKTRCPDCGHWVTPHNPLPPADLMLAAEAEANQ